MANMHETNLMEINTKDIIVDPLGQRDVEARQTEFAWIMKNFDPDIFEPINVAFVDGKYVCYDGQMRIKVAKARNNQKDLLIKAMVIYGLTMPEVADLFLKKNDPKFAVPTTLAERIRVAANYSKPEETNFLEIVEKNGFKIDRIEGSDPNAIFVGATQTLWKEYGLFKGDIMNFNSDMYILHEAFGRQKMGTNGKIIRGTGVLVRTYHGQFKEADMIASLSKVSPVDIITAAEGGRKSMKSSYYAEQMVYAYNKKRRIENQLDAELLRGAK